MNTTRKPLLTEAVMFFSEHGIAKEMLYTEFEALLDGMVATPEFADETVEAVFLQISNRLHVRAAVFFTLDFDQEGHISPLWNMPLRTLAEKAGRGPDMGGGPIRLVCLGFNPTPKYKNALWKPGQRDGRSDLVLIKESVTRNTLGIIGDDDEAVAVIPTERLQMAAEDTWYGESNTYADMPAEAKTKAEPSAAAKHFEVERALHVAQVTELQNQLKSLRQQRQAESDQLRLRHAEQLAVLQGELRDIKNELAQQQKLNMALKRDLLKLQNRAPSDVE